MLMRMLAARAHEPVTRQELVEDLGGGVAESQERAVDVQITRLRRKIENDPKAPRYLQTVRGYTPLQAGAMLLPFAAAQLIFAPRSAAAVKRFGPKVVSTVGMALVALTLAGFVFVQADTPMWVILVVFFVQGTGMANVIPPATESIMSTLPRERAGSQARRESVQGAGAEFLGILLVFGVARTERHFPVLAQRPVELTEHCMRVRVEQQAVAK